MISYKVVIEKQEAQKYLLVHGIETDISKMMVMCAYEGEKITGVGALSMDMEGALIEEIMCEGENIAYTMGKALLNSLDLGGIKKAEIKNERLFELAKKLRFKLNSEGAYEVMLEGYFTGGGCGK